MGAPLHGARAITAFLCFAAGYLLSYGLRSVNAVIAPALMAELRLSNADLGLLSSAYFVSFAAVQLPLGVWLDRYGARRTEAALLLCAALGAAVFASSSSLAGLWLGRALIGVGVSACLMAAFKAYRQWFPLERQSQLASWMLVAGTSGALTTTVPVTMAMPLVGWRGVFWIVALLVLLVALAIFVLLRETERSFGVAAAPSADAGGGYRRIFGAPYFRRMGIVGITSHGVFFALQTLWAGPWMMTVLGQTQEQTGQILFVFNFMLMLAYLLLGWAAPRMLARGIGVDRVIALGLGGTLLAQLAMLFVTSSWGWLLWLALALCIPVTTLVQSHAGLAFPAALAGRANSAYNLLIFVGAFVAQWGIGLLADAFELRGATRADALRAAFGIFLVVQAAGLAQFVARKVRTQPADS